MDKGLHVLFAWVCGSGLRGFSACLACLVGLAGSVAYAADRTRYLGAHVAAAFTEDSPWNSAIVLPNGIPAEMHANKPFDTGWGGGASIGRQFGNWRVEGEMFWRRANTEGFHIERAIVGGMDFTEAFRTIFETGAAGGGPGLVVEGRMKYLSVFANGYYDIPTPWVWHPYVGIGAGVVRRSMSKHVEIHLPPSFGATADYIEDEHEGSWDFIYQVQAGVGVQLTDTLELELGYRYKALPNAVVHFFEGGEGGAIAPAKVHLGASHSADVGLIWSF